MGSITSPVEAVVPQGFVVGRRVTLGRVAEGTVLSSSLFSCLYLMESITYLPTKTALTRKMTEKKIIRVQYNFLFKTVYLLCSVYWLSAIINEDSQKVKHLNYCKM